MSTKDGKKGSGESYFDKLKSLLIEDESVEKESSRKPRQQAKGQQVFMPSPQPTAPVQYNSSIPVLDTDNADFKKMYSQLDTAYEAANLPGVDFYEFAKNAEKTDGSLSGLIDGASMMSEGKITKTTLIDQGRHYVRVVKEKAKEIVQDGNARGQSIATDKESEESALRNRETQLQQQIQQLQNELVTVQGQIGAIDAKFNKRTSRLSEIINAVNQAEKVYIDKLNATISRIEQS